MKTIERISWKVYPKEVHLKDSGFALVQDLLARTRNLIKSTLNVSDSYESRTGSFRNLMTGDFLFPSGQCGLCAESADSEEIHVSLEPPLRIWTQAETLSSYGSKEVSTEPNRKRTDVARYGFVGKF